MPAAIAANRTPASGGSGGRATASGENGELRHGQRGTAGVAPGTGWMSVLGLDVGFGADLDAGCGGAAVHVELLDLQPLAGAGDGGADTLLNDLLAQLVARLLERRHGRGAALVELDDVPAELGMDGCLGDLARLEREGGVGEFRHHVAFLEEAEIAAIGRRRVGAVLLGQRREVAALAQFGDDGLGLVLAVNQDMARVHLLLARLFRDGGVIALAFNAASVTAGGDLAAEQGVLQHLVGGAADGVLDQPGHAPARLSWRRSPAPGGRPSGPAASGTARRAASSAPRRAASGRPLSRR